MKKKIKVFVTYSRDGSYHNTKVIDFTNFLRLNDFEANVDRSITQEATATHFGKMMHTNITESDKVIVVLSENYKVKAEKFEGGAGKEYSYIINDIDKAKDKYILVSFQKLTKKTLNKIAPLEFVNRDIVDLVKDEDEDFEQLFSKLRSSKTIQFAPISNELNLEIDPIRRFTLKDKENQADIPDLNKVTNHLLKKIGSDSYFKEYITSITCKHAIINDKLVIKKEVETRIKLINPHPKYIEEANFFTPYKFSKIDGIDNRELLKVKKLRIKVDNMKFKDISKSIILEVKEETKSKIYDNSVQFKYQKVENGHPNALIIPFENQLILDLKEERIVPIDDSVYFKRINKLTQKFELSYSFTDFRGTIIGNCFSSISEKSDITYDRDSSNNFIKIATNNWLLPGDGVSIFFK